MHTALDGINESRAVLTLGSDVRRLAAVVVAAAVAVTAIAPAASAVVSPVGADVVYADTNDFRTTEGLSTLALNAQMSAVSQAWSDAQLAELVAVWKTYTGGTLDFNFRHNPNYSRQIPSGYRAAAENVAWACGYLSEESAARALMKAWKNSAGHRANMLGNFTDIGVGFSWDAGTRCAYSTQNFAYYTATLETQAATAAAVEIVSPNTTLTGAFSLPSEWSRTTGCIAAYVATTVAGKPYRGSSAIADFWCGAVGSTFTLDVVAGTTYFLRVIAPTVTSQSAFASATPGRWWGASAADDRALSITATADSSKVMMYFFRDVSKSSAGFGNITWMGADGLSRGYSDGSYRPTADVIRRHMAAFLWAFAGRPRVDLPKVSPFTDIAYGDSGYEQMVWMAQSGVSEGYADGSYGPIRNVTRKQMALFMYRLAGYPAFNIPKVSPFKDVKYGDPGYTAMAWMAATGISSGYGDGTYKPNNNVTRMHMATFMRHFLDNVGDPSAS